MYIIFGSTRQITIGPTALLSLLTYNYTHGISDGGNNVDLVVLFTFLVGVVELLCGIFHLGFVVNFVSTPVISGFTSAAALIIASAQLKNLCGLHFNADSFIDIWINFFNHHSETKLYDVLLGFMCIVTLASLKKLNSINFNLKNSTRSQQLKRLCWFISTGRNALVVVICSSLSYYFKHNLNITPFTLTGNIVSGLPKVKLPPTTTVVTGEKMDFVDMVSYLGSGLIVVPLIALISNLALAKAFSNGGQVDATQEMIALGMCNIVGSFVQSMPVAGAFSRSAVNNSSGVRTTLGCVYTSILVLLALGFLTPYFYYIPRASLAAVIITAVLLMIDFNIITKPIWSLHKFDVLPGLITFVFCLLIGVEFGLLIGVTIDLVFILYHTATPTVSVEKITYPSSVIISYWSILIKHDRLIFPSVDHIRNIIFDEVIRKNKEGSENEGNTKFVVLDALHIKKIDVTTAQGMNSLLVDFQMYNLQLVMLISSHCQDLVLSLSRLCPDLKSVSTIEELEIFIKKSKELNNISKSSEGIGNSKTKSNHKKLFDKNQVSVNMITEDTKC
ncbi:sodium-independent sulfate anion transporter-like isoform X2 [Lycorma delicatula]